MYKKQLLNKNNAYKLSEIRSKSINEAAVEYDKSLLGAITSGIGNAFSFLTGSIKKGLSLNRIKGLSKQWSGEYARATIETYKKITGEKNVTIDNSTDETDDTDNIDVELKPVTELLAKLKNVTAILDSTSKWDFSHLDVLTSEYDQFYNKLESIKFEYIDISYMSSLINEHSYLKELKELIKKTHEKISILTTSKDVKVVISKAGDIASVSKLITELHDLINSVKSGYSLVAEEIKDNESKSDENSEYNSDNPTNDKQPDNTSESLILEAEHKLPKSILKLVTPEILSKLEQTNNIKELTNKELNLETLNKIMYEADRIIAKAKSDNEKDVSKLQQKWDINYLDTNNFFQKVIDIDIVKKQITGKVTDQTVIDKVENNSKEIDNLVKLGLTDIIASGHKFDNSKLYSFVGELKSKDKKIHMVTLLLSPISKYIDTHDDTKLFWFKLFGAYKIDKSAKIIRINPFENISSNRKLIDAGINANTSGHFYVAFRSAITIGKPRVMYVYHSKDGGMFFNNNKITQISKVDDVIADVAKQNTTVSSAISELSLTANIFKFNINQRFNTDEIYLTNKKYPGIENKDVLQDKNIDKAKSLHNDFISTIKNNLKK